jgi:type II secretory pathway pseudopilin PulG
MVELSVVVIIVLILVATAVPTLLTATRMAHLRGAATDYAGLLELARIYAIRDNNYYATYILAPSGSSAVAQVYLDLPQGSPPAKNGGTGVVTGDPTITIGSDVSVEPVGSAPNTSNLESQLLPATTPVTPTDTSVTAATFGPRGLPCTPLTLSSSVVCDSSGGATAFWTFLQNTKTGAWQAVTITPAGRIQKWFYTGSAWSKL